MFWNLYTFIPYNVVALIILLNMYFNILCDARYYRQCLLSNEMY